MTNLNLPKNMNNEMRPRDFVLILIFMIVTILILVCLFAFPPEASGQGLTASWYSVESCKREGTWQKYGGKTASGEVFNERDDICASWDYPFGTKLKITNRRNGLFVIAEVKDRGPAKRLYRKGRVVDLSKSAFSKIANLREGVVEVQIEVVR